METIDKVTLAAAALFDCSYAAVQIRVLPHIGEGPPRYGVALGVRDRSGDLNTRQETEFLRHGETPQAAMTAVLIALREKAANRIDELKTALERYPLP